MNSESTPKKLETIKFYGEEIPDVIKNWAEAFDLIAERRSDGSICFRKEGEQPLSVEPPKQLERKIKANTKTTPKKEGAKSSKNDKPESICNSKHEGAKNGSQETKIEEEIGKVNSEILYLSSLLEAFKELERRVKADAKDSRTERLESLSVPEQEQARKKQEKAKLEQGLSRLNYEILTMINIVEWVKAKKKKIQANSMPVCKKGDDLRTSPEIPETTNSSKLENDRHKSQETKKEEENQRLERIRIEKDSLLPELEYLKARIQIVKWQISELENDRGSSTEIPETRTRTNHQEIKQKSTKAKLEEELQNLTYDLNFTTSLLQRVEADDKKRLQADSRPANKKVGHKTTNTEKPKQQESRKVKEEEKISRAFAERKCKGHLQALRDLRTEYEACERADCEDPTNEEVVWFYESEQEHIRVQFENVKKELLEYIDGKERMYESDFLKATEAKERRNKASSSPARKKDNTKKTRSLSRSKNEEERQNYEKEKEEKDIRRRDKSKEYADSLFQQLEDIKTKAQDIRRQVFEIEKGMGYSDQQRESFGKSKQHESQNAQKEDGKWWP